MRKTKPFTPERLARWHKQGRGTGTLANYTPWHQVTRDDPSSRGRSHIVAWGRFNRLHHLLSDLELKGTAFVSMLSDMEDMREQFPLATNSGKHELGAYQTTGMADYSQHFPGSIELAKELGISHPVVHGPSGRVPWVLTTDLVVTRRSLSAPRRLLALCLKYDDMLTPRQVQLLRLEREYWVRRDALWLHITPRVFDPRVANALLLGVPWVIGHEPVLPGMIEYCALKASSLNRMSRRQVICLLAQRLRIPMQYAQCVFWQSVWAGALPIDLTWAGRESDPIRILEPDAFWDQNPIVSGRSAWHH